MAQIIRDRGDGGHRMELRNRMRVQLASFIGLTVFFLAVVFAGAGFRLCRAMALFLGIWSEPTLIDTLLGGYTLFFAATFIGVAVRWLLIYKWVAMRER